MCRRTRPLPWKINTLRPPWPAPFQGPSSANTLPCAEICSAKGKVSAAAGVVHRHCHVPAFGPILGGIDCPLGRVPPRTLQPRAPGGGERRCEIGRTDALGVRIDAVVYPDDDVHSARIVAATPPGGEPSATAPDFLMVAAGGAIERIGEATHGVGATAVLLDRDRQRVLVGSPAAIASLYTRLVFLDGLGASHFHKIGERTGMWGQRVTTWAIEW